MKQLCKTLLPVLVMIFIFSAPQVSFAFSGVIRSSLKTGDKNKSAIKYLKAGEFVKLSAREFIELTGKKMNLLQRLSFAITKKKIRHDLKKNPDLKITDYLDREEGRGSFNILWFLIGLAGPLLGLVTVTLVGFIILSIAPVIIAYATRQDRSKIKSVWLGFGISILVLTILLLIVAASLNAL